MALKFVKALLLLLCFFVAGNVDALIDYSNRYRSPRNPERAIRTSTSLIILHTTEAPAKSSLNKLSDRGEAHYCVVENGTVYRIIDRDREAYHAGRSMWNGRSNVDEFSIGIEVVGHHDQPITLMQIDAIRQLLAELQSLYHIDDAHVLSHGHVAYATPNKWQKRSCRGRKRCGMLFAMQSVRSRLDLKSRPAYDPDIRAKRLVQADEYLGSVLYGKVDTMGGAYGKGVAIKSVTPTERSEKTVSNKGTLERLGAFFSGFNKKEVTKPTTQPPPTKPQPAKPAAAQKPVQAKPVKPPPAQVGDIQDKYYTVGIDGRMLEDFAGDEAYTDRVIVIIDGAWKYGSKMTSYKGKKLPYGTKVLVGYKAGGPVTAKRGPISICGSRWRDKETFYLIQKTLVPGNKVNDKKLAAGTMIFYRQ